MGRNGLLLTSDFGPCVRLCKVFTDLPLKPDVSAADHVEEYCAACGQCAAACPAKAISDAPQPSFDTVGPYNRRGVRRWAVDAERCLAFWEENGTSCSTCVAACPYGLD
jgi:epoxyqueuosine reductase QueG